MNHVTWDDEHSGDGDNVDVIVAPVPQRQSVTSEHEHSDCEAVNQPRRKCTGDLLTHVLTSPTPQQPIAAPSSDHGDNQQQQQTFRVEHVLVQSMREASMF